MCGGRRRVVRRTLFTGDRTAVFARRLHVGRLATGRRLRLRRLQLLFPVLFVFPVEEIPASAVRGFRGLRPFDDRYHGGGLMIVGNTLLLLLLLMVSFLGDARQRYVTDYAAADDHVRREHFADLRRRRLFVFIGRRRDDDDDLLLLVGGGGRVVLQYFRSRSRRRRRRAGLGQRRVGGRDAGSPDAHGRRLGGDRDPWRVVRGHLERGIAQRRYGIGLGLGGARVQPVGRQCAAQQRRPGFRRLARPAERRTGRLLDHDDGAARRTAAAAAAAGNRVGTRRGRTSGGRR